MEEPDAKKFTDKLPEPLTLEKLRSHQVNITDISVEQFVEEIRTQFGFNDEQSRLLANKVFHITKEAIDSTTINEVEQHLPSDWSMMLQNA